MCLVVVNTTVWVAEMQVVAVLSEKGGAGKSTFAIHLAVAGQLEGLDSVIIDLDPQASSLGWADRRGDKPEAAAVPVSRLPKLVDSLRENGVHGMLNLHRRPQTEQPP